MLTTLFGDLEPRIRQAREDEDAPGFAATATFEDDDPSLEPAAPGEVLVGGSPAHAIREHFARARADLEQAGAMITLLDPSRLWAQAVLKALADATGQGMERLQLRERGSLRSLAVIERTAVARRNATLLKVYHPDIRALGAEHDEIAHALAERSHLTVVIVGALQPPAVEQLLRSLLAATRQPDWLCPRLLFLLPHGATALAQRVLGQDWPGRVRAEVLAESLTGASSVWNSVLAAWEAAPAAADGGDSASVARALAALARTEGVLGCALLDLASGTLDQAEGRGIAMGELQLHARALAAARAAHAAAWEGRAQTLEELLVTTDHRVLLLRALPAPASAAVLVALDRANANLALVRFKLAEAERLLR